MQGAKHEVTREGCLNTDVSSFFIAHLTYHHDIGVGAKKSPHRGCKRKTDTGLNLHLTQAVLGNFHWVFSRPDLPVGGIDIP